MKIAILLTVLSLTTLNGYLYGHCQIPCGIYEDQRRFDALFEDFDTIEKSMKMIVELSQDPAQNINQLVRWVNNKETHADNVMSTVLNYFLAQRIKFPKADDATETALYYRKLSLLHQIIVYAMKSKQTTDVKNVDQLRISLTQFRKLYFGKEEAEHLKQHHPQPEK